LGPWMLRSGDSPILRGGKIFVRQCLCVGDSLGYIFIGIVVRCKNSERS
jgi:hypothetical protein